jgi:hypothetical protein
MCKWSRLHWPLLDVMTLPSLIPRQPAKRRSSSDCVLTAGVRDQPATLPSRGKGDSKALAEKEGKAARTDSRGDLARETLPWRCRGAGAFTLSLPTRWAFAVRAGPI